MDVLNAVNEWFQSQCDGDWEHDYGITIETLDNPGWSVEIYLYETELRDKPFEQIDEWNSDQDWILCKVENYFFKGMGDPKKLERILSIFVQWQQSES